MHYLRQASGTGAGSGPTITIGPCLDSAGAEYTGLVIGDVTLGKNGTEAAMAANATLTHVSNGYYSLVMIGNNADTVGRATLRCNKSTYQFPPKEYTVLTATAYDALIANGTIASTTSGRTIVTDAAGLVDACTVKLGPSGSGAAQTARDVGNALPDAPAGAAGGLPVHAYVPGDSVTLAASLTNALRIGYRWTLALGGQDTGGSHFVGASVSGTCTGSGTVFENCVLGTMTVPAGCRFVNCIWTDNTTITLSGAGTLVMTGTRYLPGSAGFGTLDLGAAVGTSYVSLRDHQCGTKLFNLKTGDELSVSSAGMSLTFDTSCTGGTAYLSGAISVSPSVATITGQGVTIVQSARLADDTLATSAQADAIDNFIDTEISTLVTNVATILAAVDTEIASLITAVGNLPTAAAVTTAVWAAASRTLTALDEDSTTIDINALIAAAFDAVLCDKIADYILRRAADDAEGSSDGDTLDHRSLYGLIQQLQQSDTTTNAGKLTIFKTDTTTELAQLDVATDASADPVTGVG